MQHTVYRFHHIVFAACIAVKATDIPVAKHTVCLRIRNRNDHGADVGSPWRKYPLLSWLPSTEVAAFSSLLTSQLFCAGIQ